MLKKVPGTFKKKEAAHVIHRIKVLGTTNSLALRAFNTVDRVIFSCGQQEHKQLRAMFPQFFSPPPTDVQLTSLHAVTVFKYTLRKHKQRLSR